MRTYCIFNCVAITFDGIRPIPKIRTLGLETVNSYSLREFWNENSQNTFESIILIDRKLRIFENSRLLISEGVVSSILAS